MTDALARIADAVLYEGHVLWPYRRSAIKNRQRWTFGGVYPQTYARAFADRSEVQAECLLEADEPRAAVEARFLHVVHRQAIANGEPVDELAGHLTWDETTERVVRVTAADGEAAVAVSAGSEREPVDGGELFRAWRRLSGRLRLETEQLEPGLHRLRATLVNDSPWEGLERDEAVRHAFLSAHLVIRADGGGLVSAIDPPERLREHAATLRSEGLWPVLVGEEGESHVMLAAPIILPDYPEVAPESPGDFCDAGEIDGLLVLSILALTDEEKRELRAGDPRAREILERTEAMSPEDVLRLRGVIRERRPVERA